MHPQRHTPRFLFTGLLACLLLAGCQTSGRVAGRPAYATPGDAFQAMLACLRAGDEAKAEAILGLRGEEILSGDPVSDRLDRKRFLEYARAGVRVREVTPTVAWVDCGPEYWTFPVPIVKDGATWEFDGRWGREEIRNRIIGRNELATIGTLRFLADAQVKYHAMDPDRDGVRSYARRIISSPGQSDGLYWPADRGKQASPLRALAREARSEGYRDLESGKVPYHGYHFRMLHAQGRNAPGGAKNYADAEGRMTGGFALLAWPTDYERSGVMTFLVSPDGRLYEKDLGKSTRLKAARIQEFNPDASWLSYDTPDPAVWPGMR